MEKTDSLRRILSKFPYSGWEDQVETLANYFEAKKTESKVNAADTVGIHHTKATEIEETYKELAEEEKLELDGLLRRQRIESSDQVEANQEGLPA